MYLLDVNVVLAGHRADHPHHAQVRAWMEVLIDDRGDFGVPSTVWASFLRIATNRRVFAVPTPLSDAFTYIDATTAQAGFLRLDPGTRHLQLVRRLCEEGDATGDLVPDAVLGALAVEHGATVVTLDRDFARFSSVRVLRPGR